MGMCHPAVYSGPLPQYNLSGCVCVCACVCAFVIVLLLLPQNNPNTRIIIAGTENITMNLYKGNQRSMLITNCIFRLGGVALLLSNHPADRFRAKYKLKHMVRTHLGSVDEAYKCAACSPAHVPTHKCNTNVPAKEMLPGDPKASLAFPSFLNCELRTSGLQSRGMQPPTPLSYPLSPSVHRARTTCR